MKSKALLAEFLGTFALVFVGMLAIATDAVNHDIGRVGIALAHGFTIAVMASATMAISGGHFNPAVSFGMWLCKKITMNRMVGYWFAQIVGALAGAYAADACMPKQLLSGVGIMNASYGVPGVHASLSAAGGGLPTMAIFIEVILTFILMYVILGTAADPRSHKVGALVIGCAVTLDILAGGPLTGAAMNPARWLGPAFLVSRQGVAAAFINWPVYIVGPLLGATIASILYGRIPDPEELAKA